MLKNIGNQRVMGGYLTVEDEKELAGLRDYVGFL